MATFFVSFTLEDAVIDGEAYGDRWNAVYDAVHGLSERYWQDTAAFIAFESNASIGQIATAVKRAIAPTGDTVLIRSMDSKSAVIVGRVGDNDIFKIMPYLKRG